MAYSGDIEDEICVYLKKTPIHTCRVAHGCKYCRLRILCKHHSRTALPICHPSPHIPVRSDMYSLVRLCTDIAVLSYSFTKKNKYIIKRQYAARAVRPLTSPDYPHPT